jgi:NAD(P)-dependent dehydrogenase (short-subunit alcohol dehydrogenase family)
MQTLRDRVAVVTGGASGIGRALAEQFAREGMKVVLADVEEPALAEAVRALEGAGARAIGVRTDVSRAADVEALAARALEAFGAVHVVCNNAGVSVAGFSWERTLEDWQWVLGVNLWGVIHGIRTFVPILLEQKDEGHVVNTASVAGLLSMPHLSPYNVSKHGVVTLSECLHHELSMVSGGRVGVSVLCPAWVATRIADSERNRPAALARTRETAGVDRQAMQATARSLIAQGMQPAAVAELVAGAIREGRFWILPHPEWGGMVRERAAEIAEGRSPAPRIPPT